MPSSDPSYKREFSLEEILVALNEWMNIPYPQFDRLFLERHPELLTPQCRAFVEHISATYAEHAHATRRVRGTTPDVEEEIRTTRDHLLLLRDVYQRGGTATAIREAYVNMYGGFSLDVPVWIEEVQQQLGEFASEGFSQGRQTQTSALLRAAIARASTEPDLLPEIRAELSFLLQEVLRTFADADVPPTQEERITCLQKALEVYTRERYPYRYADIHHSLGIIFKHRVLGDRQHNLEEAVACFKRTLEIYTPDDFPEEHAMNQYNLGNTLAVLHTRQANSSEHQEYLKEAIACFQAALQVYTQDTFPFLYAKTQQCLGMDYADLLEHERYAYIERALMHFRRALEVFTLDTYPDNYAEVHYLMALLYKERVEHECPEALEEASACCRCALQVYTPKDFPVRYAETQNILGNLSMRRKGEANIEEAIACHNHALEVFTLEASSENYAETQNLLGNAYRERLAGVRRENEETAIIHYKCALQGFIRVGNPEGRARVQYNLGIFYSDRLVGDRANNLEQALAYCQDALEFYTRDSFPEDYAQGQNVLGNIYLQRLVGKRRDNLEEAIRCFCRVLDICTPTHYPKDYAGTQLNLGNAYMDRIEGIHRDNIEEAINCYHRALAVFTKEDFPLRYADTYNQLGIAYRERLAGDRRSNQEQAIECFQRALQLLSSETFPVEYARIQHNLANVYKVRLTGTQRANQEQAIYHYKQAMLPSVQRLAPMGYAMTLDDLASLYRDRIAGDRQENLEKAIAYHKQALAIFTREANPEDYAGALLNLSITYTQRVAGNRRANLEEAVACCEGALQIFTRQAYPREYATAQNMLGNIYMARLAEEFRYNIERAITCFERALEVATPDYLPEIYGGTQNNLGSAYRERVMEDSGENLERAIACYTRGLLFWTRDTYPIDYGRTCNALGAIYVERRVGKRGENLEEAIRYFEEALSAYASDPISFHVAETQVNLGIAYRERQKGDRSANIEEARALFEKALQIYTPNSFPLEYAMTQNNLGHAYLRRQEGEQQANWEQAIACYNRALKVYEPDVFPQHYRDTQLSLAHAETTRQNWQAAHEAYKSALKAEEDLLALGAGIVGHDVILREGENAAISNGFVLTRLSRLSEAAESIEGGRARGLAEAMALDAASPDRIQDRERRRRYEEARENFIAAQTALNRLFQQYDDVPAAFPDQIIRVAEQMRRESDLTLTTSYHNAKAAFDAIVGEIHTAQDPADFLTVTIDAKAILHAAEACGPGHAIVYLAATRWGGIAVGALSSGIKVNTEEHPDISSRFFVLDLPRLTEWCIKDLVQTRLEGGSGAIIGGYSPAQEYEGLSMLGPWAGKGRTFREMAMALHAGCQAAGKRSTLDAAAQEMLGDPEFVSVVDTSLDDTPLSIDMPVFIDKSKTAGLENLARKFWPVFLRYELERCFGVLSDLALSPLITSLLQRGVTSLTLIPCGLLAAFPLTAIPLADGRTVGETLPTSVAPSARSLSRYERSKDEHPEDERSGVYALGNPDLTLDWSEFEAYVLKLLAQNLNIISKAAVCQQATRSWLVEALRKGYIVDASCHGSFDTDNFLQTALHLAKDNLADDQRLTLADMLSYDEVNMHGLRLLILSACQTMVLDLRGAVNEVRSLAAGMLEAGAEAVLASLWSVHPRATYLLITRFAQEWLPDMKNVSPADALARAQYWLRTVTNSGLLTWYNESIPTPTEQELWQITDAGEKEQAEELIQAKEVIEELAQSNLEAVPFADPYFWAGFQIMGW